MNNANFRIRLYSKGELARLYFPDMVNGESATANFRNLMRHNPYLIAELKEAYYKTYNKTFTPRQVGIIVQYLGELWARTEAISYSLPEPLVIH